MEKTKNNISHTSTHPTHPSADKPGYKHTALGWIPEDWEVHYYSDIISQERLGGNYENSESYEGVPVIKMGNIQRGYIDVESLQHLPKDTAYAKEDILKEGDLLFNTRNTLDLVGKVAIWKNNLPLAVYNSNLLRLKFKSSFVGSNYFMNYCFNSKYILNQLRARATGTTSVAAIYTRDLSSLKIILPPLPEQTAIANLLSTWDAAINKLQALIDAKTTRKKWLMQQLLTGKKRLPGFEGEWKFEILGNVVSLQHGYQFRDDDFVKVGIPVIKIRNVIGYDLELSDLTFVDENRLEEFRSVVIENGDLLMSLTGNIGRVVEVKGIDRPMFQNYRVGKFIPLDKQITKAFLKFLLSSDFLFKQFNGLANQSAQANFGKQDMDKLKFSFPISSEEQIAIAQVLKSADDELRFLIAQKDRLRDQKKGLMQQLLTGKKRLKYSD